MSASRELLLTLAFSRSGLVIVLLDFGFHLRAYRCQSEREREPLRFFFSKTVSRVISEGRKKGQQDRQPNWPKPPFEVEKKHRGDLGEAWEDGPADSVEV